MPVLSTVKKNGPLGLLVTVTTTPKFDPIPSTASQSTKVALVPSPPTRLSNSLAPSCQAKAVLFMALDVNQTLTVKTALNVPKISVSSKTMAPIIVTGRPLLSVLKTCATPTTLAIRPKDVFLPLPTSKSSALTLLVTLPNVTQPVMVAKEPVSTLPSIALLPLLLDVKPGTVTLPVEVAHSPTDQLAPPSTVSGTNGALGLLAQSLVVVELNLKPEPRTKQPRMVVSNVQALLPTRPTVTANAVLLIVDMHPGEHGLHASCAPNITATEPESSTATTPVVVSNVTQAFGMKVNALLARPKTVKERTKPQVLVTVSLMELLELPTLPSLSPKSKLVLV